jgi:hypothetical protein
MIIAIISYTVSGILLHWNKRTGYVIIGCADLKIKLISFGVGLYVGFPKTLAAHIALKTTREWLEINAEKVDYFKLTNLSLNNILSCR